MVMPGSNEALGLRRASGPRAPDEMPLLDQKDGNCTDCIEPWL